MEIINEYRILIVDDSFMDRQILKKLVLTTGDNIRVEEAENAIDALNKASALVPDMIFLDINMPKMTGPQAVEKFKNLPGLGEVAIFIISSLNDIDEIIQKCSFLRINGFISKPFSSHVITQSVQETLERVNKYRHTHTSKFIRASVKRAGSYELSQKMRALAKIVATFNDIKGQEANDIYNALSYLSISLKNNSYDRDVSFFDEVGFAREIFSLLKECATPKTKNGEIVHAIYYLYHHLLNDGDINSWHCEHIKSSIAEDVRTLYKQNAVCIKDGYGIELIWEKLQDILVDMPTHQNNFLELINALLTRMLLFHGGGIAKINNSNEMLSVSLTFMDKSQLDNIAAFYTNFDHSINVTISENDTYRNLVVSLSKDSSPSTELNTTAQDDMFFDFDSPTSSATTPDDDFGFFDFDSPAQQYEEETRKISAQDYIAEGDFDPHDISALIEIEEDMFDVLAKIDISHNIEKEVILLTDFIRRYGTSIMYLSEFKNLSGALMRLGGVFGGTEIGIEAMKLSMIIELLTHLIYDLKNWRETVFIRVATEDIHFLDKSIIASCDQSIHFIESLKPKLEDDNKGELELF